MHGRTIATLEKLKNAPWFSNVGVHDTESKIIVLKSWQEAVEHCSLDQWNNLQMEASNRYRERLVERSKERFDHWNEIAVDLKKTTVPFVRRKVEPVVREHNLPKAVENAAQWDILGVCMEAEYADVYPPGFYAAQSYWYVSGHFPCGWEGDFPNGTRVIF